MLRSTLLTSVPAVALCAVGLCSLLLLWSHIGSAENQDWLLFEVMPLELRAESTTPETRQIEARSVNRTNDRVRILGIDTSCGCTVVGKMDAMQIAPGATLRIPLSVTPPARGARTVSVRVRTDHPKKRLVTCEIQTVGYSDDLPKLVQLVSSIPLSGFQPGEALSERFAIRTLEEKNSRPWIEQLTADSTDVLLDSLPVVEERSMGGEAILRSYAYQVTVPCPERVNQIREHLLRLKFSRSPDPQSSPIRVKSFRKAIVQLIPEIVNVTVAVGDLPVERFVVMESEHVSDWSCRLASDLPQGVTIDFLESSEVPQDRSRRIRIHVDPARLDIGSDSVERFRLSFATSIPQQPTLELPVTVS
jgi:hypothetical protein